MLAIPTQATPNQQLSVSLAGQPCRINICTKSTGMYVDLYVNNVLIMGGMLGRNAVRMVRNAYLGFVGDLAFFDTQGTDDPVYAGLGPNGRWFLAYLAVTDITGDV